MRLPKIFLVQQFLADNGQILNGGFFDFLIYYRRNYLRCFRYYVIVLLRWCMYDERTPDEVCFCTLCMPPLVEAEYTAV
jgi:hypothetical protein